MAGGPVISPQHARWARFCHASQGILSLMWLSACMLMYFHAPSFQAEQLYDCRWHLSCLVISAGFGYLFLKAPSALTFGASFVAAQYSIVYSFLSLVIYGVDSLMIVNGPPNSITANPAMTFSSYLKLSTVLIVLSGFGLGISLIYVHRLFLIGWEMAPPKRIQNLKTIQIFSALHACFALFTMYVVEELTPFKTWFIRVYMVHEFSCSLLSLSLAVLQITGFVNSNSVILKAVFIMNLCQFVQELQIGSSAFFTAFYIQKLSQAIQMKDISFRMIIVILNLIAHVCRMAMCGVTGWIIGPIVWDNVLQLRVVRKIDRERLTANQDYLLALAKENRWLLYICAWASVIAIGHFALNTVYVIMGSVIEALMIAAGTSFLFSLLVLAAIILYLKKRYRLALICCSYFTLNLFVSAGLMVTSFIQDIIFGVSGPSSRYAFLYLSDVGLSVLTLIVSVKVLKFCMRTLLETFTLTKQPLHVQKAVKFLRNIGLFSLLTIGIEFCLLLELRIDAMAGHLSMTSSIHDWLITTVQSVFLYWVTKHERYQCVLLVLIFQLANVSLVSLDLLAQQTDLMQMLITLLFQHGQLSQNLRTSIPNFPIDHFVVILVLHFLQITQWFMSVLSLGICVYIIDSIVEDDSVKSNDNHEISVLGMDIGSEVTLEAVGNGHSPSTKKVPAKKEAPRESNGPLSFDNALFNDPLAMSRLPDPERKDSGVEETEMEDVVDVPLDDPKRP